MITHKLLFAVALSFAGAATLTSCGTQRHSGNAVRVQGYVEGEFVYVAAPSAGNLQSLLVHRGEQVTAGKSLYELESAPEQSQRDETFARLAAARANLEDAKKGRRPTEIDSLTAQRDQAIAALQLSENNLSRLEKLVSSGAISQEDLDRARASRTQEFKHVAQLRSDLATAQLGARSDLIEAAEANVHALEALLTKAEWDLSQKRPVATQNGLVHDTLFREGEWVAAGRPVVVLLPPENIKVRAFVPEPQIGGVQLGQAMQVFVDGGETPLAGTVAYISSKAEFTPPVIYSREVRSKLVFLVELRFQAEVAERLHPGQPVDVEFVSQP